MVRVENVIEVTRDTSVYYFSFLTSNVISNGTLGIGAIFARSLNIQEGDEVFVSTVKQVSSLSSINVVPLTMNDRELLELQMEKVQSSLLSQVRVVAKRQPIVAWVSKFSSVTFVVEDLEPRFSYGLLQQFTEVHVLDADATRKNADVIEQPGVMRNALARILPYFSKEHNADDNASNCALLQDFRKRSLPRVFRVYPLPFTSTINPTGLILRAPSHILIPRRCLPKSARSATGRIMCKVKKVPEERQRVNDSGTNFLRDGDSSVLSKVSDELTARIYVLEDVLERGDVPDTGYFDLDSIHSRAYASDSLRISLQIGAGSRMVVQLIEESRRPKPTSLDVFAAEGTTVQDFRSYVKLYSRDQPLLLNSRSILLDQGRRYVVQMSPEDCDYAFLDDKDIESLHVRVQPALYSANAEILEAHCSEDLKLGNTSTRCVESVLDSCEKALDLGLGLRIKPDTKVNFLYDRENILICGDLGSGKTTVCKILIDRCRKEPCFVHTRVIDCRSLKGKKVETVQKIFASAMNECVYHQPSILFMDDLECITNASLNDEENTVDATNASRITDMLINTVTQYQKSHYISIVATCMSVNKIGLKLRPARGTQFFRTVLSIPNLNKEHRIDILRTRLKDKLPEDMGWDHYGNKTEGWMPQDLVDLSEKAIFAAWKRHAAAKSESRVIVTEEDMSVALENFTPISMQDVQLHKKGGHSWSDIGGLSDVKNSLTEILHWPLKYPEIFKNAPIKLQSGVLLYGMPGTGKTMLAKAIASECGVNLISIKGPELLSKYIGVSEESVRNVFERARRAKPCVLFFDEFDSLAPRRGHDNTGVTDRVVNQLLTQLDGVEDREGVAIVAASSRPDMLDPALLRPGRLDKCLHCPLPNEEERREIFMTLCNSQNVDSAKLDLEELTRLSDGFTGADINATIIQARLAAYENAVATSTNGKIDASDIKVVQKHLVDSVKSIRPSLSAAEKSKYTNVYARFSKDDTYVEDVSKNQKATLA
ncbi:PREDICTED: peroxisome biogenesis factor 1 isoform X2 [Dinoponera quadriceps]|uniref:Peroxisomal ATPase PEX1 n=1 Tax=Dinoponera quadriceps TaxID=609295 RepID=A0A6P3XTH0_DINQU|nr:PREDICTED: peroxisome biogenesis factor 1 isoform X2 [Dinoponera quadriceps]